MQQEILLLNNSISFKNNKKSKKWKIESKKCLLQEVDHQYLSKRMYKMCMLCHVQDLVQDFQSFKIIGGGGARGPHSVRHWLALQTLEVSLLHNVPLSTGIYHPSFQDAINNSASQCVNKTKFKQWQCTSKWKLRTFCRGFCTECAELSKSEQRQMHSMRSFKHCFTQGLIFSKALTFLNFSEEQVGGPHPNPSES